MSVKKFRGKKATAFCDVLGREYANHGFVDGELVQYYHKGNTAVSAVQYDDLLITVDGVRLFNKTCDKLGFLNKEDSTPACVYGMCKQFVTTHYPCVLLNEYRLVNIATTLGKVWGSDGAEKLAKNLTKANLGGKPNEDSRTTRFYYRTPNRWKCKHVTRRVEEQGYLKEFISTQYLVVGVANDTVVVKRYINLNGSVTPYYPLADFDTAGYPEVVLKLPMSDFKRCFIRSDGWRVA